MRHDGETNGGERLPYWPHRETSRWAADYAALHAPNQRARVYYWLLLQRSRMGGTPDEWCVAADIHHTGSNGRFSELERLGLVFRHGMRETRTGALADVFFAYPRTGLTAESFMLPEKGSGRRGKWEVAARTAYGCLVDGDISGALDCLEALCAPEGKVRA
jgi:hypothetical protein